MYTRSLPLLAGLLLTGCFGVSDHGTSSQTDTDTTQNADTVRPHGVTCEDLGDLVVASVSAGRDVLLRMLVQVPERRERHVLATLDVSWSGAHSWTFDEARVGFASGAPEVTLTRDDAAPTAADNSDDVALWLAAGEEVPTTVDVTLLRDGEAPCTVSLDLPAPPPVAARVTSAVADADGMIWSGTVMDGLIGHAGRDVAAPTIHYAGVLSTAPYDTSYPGPQSGLILPWRPPVGTRCGSGRRPPGSAGSTRAWTRWRRTTTCGSTCSRPPRRIPT